MQPATTGFDAPTKADRLGRGPFAADIARIATRSPSDWSVRIGVYGRWGTGKTSVLLMVQDLVEARDHKAVWFNPWGHESVDEMWTAFVEEVFSSLQEWGVQATGAGMAKLKKHASSLVDIGKDAAKPVGAVFGAGAAADSVAQSAAPFLLRWLKTGSEDLKGLSDALDGQRIVVLMDDVDRADPRVLPKMFHAVKELLNLPGFSFVLALDPNVVGPALRRHHEGFGVEFLEKVIDFPKWLPEPTREALWEIAAQDLTRYCSFLDAGVVSRNFSLLPSNPRRLRMFIRQLWSLEEQVLRHDPDELDQAVLVLVHLLRVRWPDLARAVLATDDFLQQLALMHYFGKKDPQTNKTVDQITAFCQDVLGEDSAEVPPAAALLREIGDGARLLTTGQLRYLAYLTERPHSVTWREFRALLESWDRTAAGLDSWVDHQAKDHPCAGVRQELYAAAAIHLQRCCERAADNNDEDVLVEAVQSAEVATRMLGILWKIDEALRTAASFGRVLSVHAGWAHFQNHEAYRAQRQRERTLLLEMAESAPNEVTPRLYEMVAGVSRSDLSSMGRQEAGALIDQVAQALGPRVADTVLQLFSSPQGVFQTTRGAGLRAEQMLLFDGTGPLWTDRRQAILSELGRAKESSVVWQNALDLLRALAEKDAGVRGIGAASPEAVTALLSAEEIMHALWSATCSRRPNPRLLRSLDQMRRAIEVRLDEELDLPGWWQQMAAEVGLSDPANQLDDEAEK